MLKRLLFIFFLFPIVSFGQDTLHVILTDIVVYNSIADYNKGVNFEKGKINTFTLQNAECDVFLGDELVDIIPYKYGIAYYPFPVKDKRQLKIVIKAENCYPNVELYILTDEIVENSSSPFNKSLLVGSRKSRRKFRPSYYTPMGLITTKFSQKEWETFDTNDASNFVFRSIGLQYLPDQERFWYAYIDEKDSEGLYAPKELNAEQTKNWNDSIREMLQSERSHAAQNLNQILDTNTATQTLTERFFVQEKIEQTGAAKYNLVEEKRQDEIDLYTDDYLYSIVDSDLHLDNLANLDSLEYNKYLLNTQRAIIKAKYKNAKTRADTIAIKRLEERLLAAEKMLNRTEEDLSKQKEITSLRERLILEQSNTMARNQKIILVIVILALLTLLGMIISLWNYRKTKRQKVLIEEQKEEVESQRDAIESQKKMVETAHGEVQSSINYAKRIQDAILPTIVDVNKHIPENFILFQPKDIVSGDFYWFESVGDYMYLAAADCTGHGVPGAMVSVVCAGALNRCVLEFDLTKPSEILDKTRELVVETFANSRENVKEGLLSETRVKDGMDISLIRMEKGTTNLLWAGANNPIYILRKGANEIESIKGNREPIGYTEVSTPFTNHEIQLESGDAIYLFSDGYADQFGGPKGRKLGYKFLRKLLAEHSQKTMKDQKSILLKGFKDWMNEGKEEQVDDVCIIGVKL